MKRLVIAVTLLTAGTTCFAKDLLSATFNSCMDRSGGVTSEMLNCIDAETRRQDAALNRNYQAAIKGLSPERRQKLVIAQRAWLAFRKSESDFTADPDRGTAASVNAADEFMQMTARRADELAAVASQNGG